MHVDDGTGTNHNMQCEFRPRQELSMQTSARAFNANKWMLCDTEVSITQKLGCFDRVIFPIACFAAGHEIMDVAYRRPLRSVVRPLRNMDSTLPWHDMRRIWNERVPAIIWQTASKSWSAICLRRH